MKSEKLRGKSNCSNDTLSLLFSFISVDHIYFYFYFQQHEIKGLKYSKVGVQIITDLWEKNNIVPYKPFFHLVKDFCLLLFKRLATVKEKDIW